MCLCDVRLANGAPATAPNKEIWPARAWRVSPNSTMGLLSTVVAFLHSLKSPRQNEPGHASKSHANDCGDWCRHIMWWWWGGILHPSIHQVGVKIVTIGGSPTRHRLLGSHWSRIVASDNTLLMVPSTSLPASQSEPNKKTAVNRKKQHKTPSRKSLKTNSMISIQNKGEQQSCGTQLPTMWHGKVSNVWWWWWVVECPVDQRQGKRPRLRNKGKKRASVPHAATQKHLGRKLACKQSKYRRRL